MLEGLCEWLETETDLVGGVSLYPGYVPKSAATDIVISCVAEQTPSVWSVRSNQERMIQVVTRGPSYIGARTQAELLAKTLCNRFGMAAIPGWILYSITGGGPGYLGPDALGRHVFSANYLVLAREET